MDDLTEKSDNVVNTISNDLDYLRGVKSSTCLLLSSTPSPNHLDLKHPLSEEISDGSFLALKDEPGLLNLQNSGDSSSSVDSNSVVQDPVSAQLINNISMLEYQTLSKNGDAVMGQVEDCKLNGNGNISNRKLPSFVNWNWPLIRKILLWVVLSGLVACLGAIIAMVISIPKQCNPDLPWHQGKVFYEVFPEKFKDSNDDGIGDLKGLINKLDYIEKLGPSAIRLNHIFDANKYPGEGFNSTFQLNINPRLGDLKDFQDLVTAAHSKHMYIILDISVTSMITNYTSSNNTIHSYKDPTSATIAFWAISQNVDGFYLKNLDKFVEDPNFGKSLKIWKQAIGFNKILIASEKAFETASGVASNFLLSCIDLIDVHLDLLEGVDGLKNTINNTLSGKLWERADYPWVHWNIGNTNSERISTKLINNSMTLTALQFILPGTVSIFYGDEVLLGQFSAEENVSRQKYNQNGVLMFTNSEKNEETIETLSLQAKLESKYDSLEVIKLLIKVKLENPTIYVKAIYKDGDYQVNAEVCKTDSNLLVIERWYPRRNTCVFVGNFGSHPVTTDLSSMFYGGAIIAATNSSLVGENLQFDHVTFPPHSAIILKLEK